MTLILSGFEDLEASFSFCLKENYSSFFNVSWLCDSLNPLDKQIVMIYLIGIHVGSFCPLTLAINIGLYSGR